MTMDKMNLPATKADIKDLATKADFKSLAIEITRTNVRIDALEQRLTERMTAESSKILKVVEDFTVQTQKVDRDQIITRYRLDELENRVKTLEH